MRAWVALGAAGGPCGFRGRRFCAPGPHPSVQQGGRGALEGHVNMAVFSRPFHEKSAPTAPWKPAPSCEFMEVSFRKL